MAISQPATEQEAVAPVEPHNAESAHRGSSSIRLSAGSVVGAWLGSIAVHIALFAAMLALVLPLSRETITPDTPVTQVELVGSFDAGGVAPTKIAGLPASSEPAALDAPPVPTPVHFAPPAELTAAGSGSSRGGMSSGSPGKTPGLSIVGLGVGGGGGGDSADGFGLKAGGSGAPQFFGLGTTAKAARTVVYVVDMSGSMQDTFDFVRAELRRSISSLRRSQKFHVIFFNGMVPLENPPLRLVNAIEANKEDFFDFLSRVLPTGSTEPAAAMQLALKLRPDLIYLLSDGVDFPPRLMNQLDEWNKDRRVRISTIAYLTHEEEGRGVLESIAREHHGEFKFVSDDELP